MTDIRLLGFELVGFVIQPLEQELADVMEDRACAPGAVRALDWVCRAIIGRTAAHVETAVDALLCRTQTPSGEALKSLDSTGIHELDLCRRPAAAHE